MDPGHCVVRLVASMAGRGGGCRSKPIKLHGQALERKS